MKNGKQIINITEKFGHDGLPTLKKKSEHINKVVTLKIVNTNEKRITKNQQKLIKKGFVKLATLFDGEIKVDIAIEKIRETDRSLVNKINYISVNVKTNVLP